MATLAVPLEHLRDDYLNIKWPNRSRSSDGWIGDEAHKASGSPENGGSDHNVNERGYVDALDVTRVGIHVPTVIASMLVHPSTHYVIFNRRIFSARDAFTPRVYTGDNPHTEHIHDSIFQTILAEHSMIGYKFILTPMSWPTLLKVGARGVAVRELQAYLNGWGFSLILDGDFGAHTESSVRTFQTNQHIGVDGIVGPNTRGKLRPFA